MDDLLKYTKLLQKFQAVERGLYVTGQDRRENDVEHSYELAMLGWYIVASKNLPLDLTKVLKYALVHDLVEIYAGDTYFYSKDKKVTVTKVERERDAAARIAKEFPEFEELHKLIEGYEERADPESRFIYALDKIIPIINVYLDNGRSWKEVGVTLDMIVSGKLNKVTFSPEIKGYFDELLQLLTKREDTLFPKGALFDQNKIKKHRSLFDA